MKAIDRPQPRLDRMRGNGMAATVGRLRECTLLDWKFVVLSHNTIRGAAGAAVLNAEVLARMGKLDKMGAARGRSCASAGGGDGVSGSRTDLVVMKFGGTSVEDARAMERTAAIVRGTARDVDCDAVVVVSAMAKVTDQLLAAAAAAGRGDKLSALAICGAAAARGMSIRRRSCWRGDGLRAMHATLGNEFDALDDLLRGIAAVGELTPRTNDLVVSFGERMSSRMVAEAFAQRGLDGAHVDARTCIMTDANYGKAVPHGGGDRGEADGDCAAAA